MVNVTEYLKKHNLYTTDIIRSFLKLQSVKYFIGHEKKVISKRGRYNSYTKFSDDLFELFLNWLERKPIPLLNRKEYEVSSYIFSYFKDAVYQYKLKDFIFDWYIPSLDLIIEFNESTHNKKSISEKDYIKLKSHKGDIFIIHEESVMNDLANLSKKYRHN